MRFGDVQRRGEASCTVRNGFAYAKFARVTYRLTKNLQTKNLRIISFTVRKKMALD